ncbi:LPXTG-motif cell wall anchor domain protein [Marvinbryantia formatexigens DSM 14469]|uniref:LPXTG-motif cell wall anchor domain protein n=1 Tax=Marvinbryantia formatexigens DSM 14469 TaxID=478749 RepID=C6LJ72_9FIRM|nr:LPXTG cell wall anchor domain-containing protein [Marvinbryantia formatexigens]EET59392.1 LPXTG-motif cell wall anchor domain protein [Marvinbryantia formatexigens DSM 14469]UWO24349.1 LPXTG cell wall anchor domain-containing protein [Marvinbryantia formatexigens DSM 14469]SDF52844.1 LPXTG-motif cell wall anchor domain-containing protein [Marvinbryantia formatexigens]
MKKNIFMPAKGTAWLMSLALAFSWVPAVSAEAPDGEYTTESAQPEDDGTSVFVITGFPELEKDSEGNFTDSSIQEKYGNLTAEPGTTLENLGLPVDLKVTGYLESDGPDAAKDTTFSQMVWKLKSDTGELYSESSPEGSYTFVPDFDKYLESGSVSYDEIKLADDARTPSLTVTIAAPQTEEPETETETTEAAYTEASETEIISDYTETDATDTEAASEGQESETTDVPDDENVLSSETGTDAETESEPDYINNTDDSLINADGTVMVNGETVTASGMTESETETETTAASGTEETASSETETAGTDSSDVQTETAGQTETTVQASETQTSETQASETQASETQASESETSEAETTQTDAPAADLAVTFAITDGTNSYSDTNNNIVTLKADPADGENRAQVTLPCNSSMNLSAITVSFADAYTGAALSYAPVTAQDYTTGAKNYEIYAADANGNQITYPFTLEIAKANHTWGAEATCTTAQTCTVCGAENTPALGHDFKDATCTAPKTCTRCGATEGEALGHDWTPATCTEPKTCERCGATEGKALGHDLRDNWKVVTASTDTEHGEEIRYCQRDNCDYSETRPLNIIGDPANNGISGLTDGTNYNLNTALTFTAYGAGMGNSNPINGDVRYVPSSWMVESTPGTFRDNFSGSFSITQSGRYTLTVTYQKQVYDNGWQVTDIADSKSITITVGDVISANTTANNNAIRINPQTGDSTPIAAIIIVLVVALVVIIAAVIYKKKRNK